MRRRRVIVTSDTITDVLESIVPGCRAVLVYVKVLTVAVKVAKKGV